MSTSTPTSETTAMTFFSWWQTLAGNAKGKGNKRQAKHSWRVSHYKTPAPSRRHTNTSRPSPQSRIINFSSWPDINRTESLSRLGSARLAVCDRNKDEYIFDGLYHPFSTSCLSNDGLPANWARTDRISSGWSRKSVFYFSSTQLLMSPQQLQFSRCSKLDTKRQLQNAWFKMQLSDFEKSMHH